VEHFLFADNNLCHAGRVTEVYERHTTVITAAAYPAGQGYGLSNVLGTEGSEVMRAQHSTPF
jgi:hypothetical protein